MQQYEQFYSKVNDMDISDEAKASINKLAKTLENTHIDVIDSRGAEKTKKNEALERLKAFQDKTGVEKADEIVKDKPNEEIEKIKQELSDKYSLQMKEALTKNEELQTSISKIKAENEDMLFTNSITENGLLDGFDITDPDTVSLVTKRIRDKAVFIDGKAYVNDGSGGIAKDIATGEPMKLSTISESIKSSINPKYLSTQTNGNGSGMNPQQQQSVQKGTKISDYSSAELVEMRKTNIAQYNALEKNI